MLKFGSCCLILLLGKVISTKTLYLSPSFTPHYHQDNGGSIGEATFGDSLSVNGWTKLRVTTNGSYSDEIQSRAAGVLEGLITAERILQSWTNTMEGYCQDPATPYCKRLLQFVESNIKWMEGMIRKNPGEVYWNQVSLILTQLKGLNEGFNYAYPGRLRLIDFYLMNLSGDLEDLESALNAGQEDKVGRTSYGRMLGTGSCSALIKWVPGELMTSHITWNSYQSMIRVIKKYDLKLQGGTPHQRIPGQVQVFTSYPGYLASGDDYTLIGSGLLSQETTIGNSNSSLWKHVTTKTVPEWIRSVVANRLADSGKSWSDWFQKWNSGTYNNQWMIVDYNQFDPTADQLKDGTLWILEQIPGLILAEDQTDVLRRQKYWPSYNTPFYPDIFNMSGCQENVEKYGSMFAYDSTPRALIFKRDQGNVVDMDSLYKLMRYNDYKNDPLSACECTPPYSAENSIAARSDLNPANGTYQLPFLGHRLHGATDYKGTNHALFSKLEFWAAAGPTWEQQEPFRWSTSDWANFSHVGMVDLAKFQPILVSYDDDDRAIMF